MLCAFYLGCLNKRKYQMCSYVLSNVQFWDSLVSRDSVTFKCITIYLIGKEFPVF